MTAKDADIATVRDSGAEVVTTLSQVSANEGSCQGAVQNGSCWLNCFERHRDATKFNPRPTGGQVVAGSNSVSPTIVSPTMKSS